VKHAREDYNRIQDPENLIPEDEPVFLLRGQDIVAATLVRLWAKVNEQEGGSPEASRLAREHADRMDAWPKHKRCDLPGDPK